MGGGFGGADCHLIVLSYLHAGRYAGFCLHVERRRGLRLIDSQPASQPAHIR